MPDRREPHSTLQRAFAVIKLLADSGHPMNAPDIGTQLDMNRQTVHRLLNQLEALGIVRRDVARERFEIGPALVELGLRAQTGNHATKLRRAVMEELVAKIGEDCNLAILDGYEIVYIDHVQSDWPLRRQIQIGARMPAYCTAIGKVLLAHLPERALDQYLSVVTLERRTENTCTDPDMLRDNLIQVREQGYAIADQENLVGLLSVAVPVWDPLGRVVAGLSMHGPNARLTQARAHAIVPELKEAAETISNLIVESSSQRVTR
ncbi:IclR family transcriptional regulator [Dichotomicrobium thermohalophilum]|uniref:IclR family transcriptional regulator n=1 Tax=Dichotomicrobium thermohalophilum TaxID=933063 RepID=A0A397Q2T1_9HYPH|nr:IclR family transcriptional regulator [Dichotomicrobium thermohalophilum]